MTTPIRRPEDVGRWVESGMNLLTFGSDTNLLGSGIALYQKALEAAKKQ